MAALNVRWLRILVVMVLCLPPVLSGCSPNSSSPNNDVVVDLLQQNWQDMPGVTVDEGELQVTATSRSIVAQDRSWITANPPVNLAGTHLVVGRDFMLSAAFIDIDGDASWTLYDSPPIVTDEFRIETAHLRLTLRGDDLEIAVTDGSSPSTARQPQLAHHEHVMIADSGGQLSVRRSGDTLQVESGERTVSSLSLGGIFESGALWLGFSSDEGSFRVSSFFAEAPSGAELSTAGPAVMQAEQAEDGLHALATRSRPGFTIGAAVALGPLVADTDYAREFVENFGGLTMENAMKPQSLSPSQGVYTFEEADAILAIARDKDMAVHGHTVAFTEAMPAWMHELPVSSERERHSSGEALLDYVTTVVTHFKGRLDSIDIVNEPFDVEQGTELQQNIWYRVFGADYPVVVSQAVYEADPLVKQFINENGAEAPGNRREALLQLALDTNAMGGHVYGVGLQAHVYDFETDAISAEDLSDTLDLFDEAGIHVRISENDVTDALGTDAQAAQYSVVLTGCLRSPACVSYTTWGVDDRYNWWLDGRGELQQGHDFVFDNGRKTQAYEAMQRALGG